MRIKELLKVICLAIVLIAIIVIAMIELFTTIDLIKYYSKKPKAEEDDNTYTYQEGLEPKEKE